MHGLFNIDNGNIATLNNSVISFPPHMSTRIQLQVFISGRWEYEERLMLRSKLTLDNNAISATGVIASYTFMYNNDLVTGDKIILLLPGWSGEPSVTTSDCQTLYIGNCSALSGIGNGASHNNNKAACEGASDCGKDENENCVCPYVRV